jgi:phage gpG-like protein
LAGYPDELRLPISFQIRPPSTDKPGMPHHSRLARHPANGWPRPASLNHGSLTTSMTPGQAAAALADIPIAETLATAVAAQAARLADAVRINLATPPGGLHDQPWRQTGTLQSSIATAADGLAAQIGSNDPAAAPQELGTATIPPRPFLGPSGASLAESISRDIGKTLADLLARRLT